MKIYTFVEFGLIFELNDHILAVRVRKWKRICNENLWIFVENEFEM